MRSVPVANDEAHRVATKFKGNLKNSPVEGVTTLYELAQNSFKNYGHCNAIGQREYLGLCLWAHGLGAHAPVGPWALARMAFGTIGLRAHAPMGHRAHGAVAP